jgi:hypothetical protein
MARRTAQLQGATDPVVQVTSVQHLLLSIRRAAAAAAAAGAQGRLTWQIYIGGDMMEQPVRVTATALESILSSACTHSWHAKLLLDGQCDAGWNAAEAVPPLTLRIIITTLTESEPSSH